MVAYCPRGPMSWMRTREATRARPHRCTPEARIQRGRSRWNNDASQGLHVGEFARRFVACQNPGFSRCTMASLKHVPALAPLFHSIFGIQHTSRGDVDTLAPMIVCRQSPANPCAPRGPSPRDVGVRWSIIHLRRHLARFHLHDLRTRRLPGTRPRQGPCVCAS